MQKYINHLIRDIEEVIHTRWRKYPPHFYTTGIPDPYLIKPKGFVDRPPGEVSFENQVAEVEIYTKGEATNTMFDYFGFSSELFPPINILTKKQADALTQMILRMWAAFNYMATFPKDTPSEILYPILCKQMKEPQLLLNNGIIGIEFCEYNPKTCPFDSYCTCE